MAEDKGKKVEQTQAESEEDADDAQPAATADEATADEADEADEADKAGEAGEAGETDEADEAGDEADEAGDEADESDEADDEADEVAAAAEPDEPSEPQPTGVIGEVLAELDSVDALELVAIGGGATLALAKMAETDAPPERDKIARALVAAFAKRGQRVAPALYDARSWQEVVLAGDGASRWTETFGDQRGLLRHVEILRGSRDWPTNARRVLLPRVREHLKVIAFTQRSPDLPPQLSLSLAARVCAETVAALCALRGAPYPTDQLDDVVGGTTFSADDFALVGELEGLAAQVEHYERMTLLDIAERVDWQAPLERAYDLVRRFERYVLVTLSSEAELVRRRRMRWGGAVAAAALVGIFGAWRYAATRPIPALKDQSAIKDAGGIVGTYYLGRDYRKRVARRTDTRIDFNTGGSPHAKVTRDNFSVRWEGYIRFTRGGKQVLCGESDDGNRIWINDKKVVDDWKVHAKKRTCATLRVTRGWYKLRVDYFDKIAGATMRLLRGRRESALRPVPSRDLCCKGDDARAPARRPPQRLQPAVPKPKAPAPKAAPPAKAAPPRKAAPPAKAKTPKP